MDCFPCGSPPRLPQAKDIIDRVPLMFLHDAPVQLRECWGLSSVMGQNHIRHPPRPMLVSCVVCTGCARMTNPKRHYCA